MSVVEFPPPAAVARNLPEVVAVFRKWMHMPDPDPLYAVIGAIVANRLPGDPIWLLLVCGSSWGKSEILGSTTKLLDVFRAATLTEASLLSGTSKRDKAKDAKGGLLREIGPYGIIVCKDFGSVLSMSRDPRAAVLAALREIYDGAWSRHVGTDGGRSLHWNGKVGFLGACTPNIDRHHAVMASMGERFAFIRLADTDDVQVAQRALQHAGKERVMRDELSDAVLTFLDGLEMAGDRPELTDDERDRLIALTTLTVRCRSAIERDSYSREIELVPGAESPGRLTRVAANLLTGLHVIGLPRPDAWRVVQRVILDSMPQLRRKVMNLLQATRNGLDTTEVAEACGYPTGTARRVLEELAAYGVANRESAGKGKADLWALSDWTRDKLAVIGGVPEMSEGVHGDQGGDDKTLPITTPIRVLTDKTGKVTQRPLIAGIDGRFDL